MTIQQAIERAKQLQKSRAAESQRTSQPQVTTEAATTDQFLVSQTAQERFAELAQVEFNDDICSEYHVLYPEGRPRRADRAEAAYRLLRSRVQHRVNSGHWNCIGITSPGIGEGKTVTTLNVAISIARERQRPVYVLDLDMRRPSVFRYVGARPERSLSQYFTESMPANKVLFATPIQGLFLAGASHPVEGASEMLAGSKLKELLAHIRGLSPTALIIIDLPPVTSTDEALLVAPTVDGMFLVVSEGITRRDALSKTLNLLGDFQIAGIILNRSLEHVSRDYYNAY